MVKLGCERTMGRYGYPWPKMLDCANFPADNDMCIRLDHVTRGQRLLEFTRPYDRFTMEGYKTSSPRSQAVMEMEEKEKRMKEEREKERGSAGSSNNNRKRNRNKKKENISGSKSEQGEITDTI